MKHKGKIAVQLMTVKDQMVKDGVYHVMKTLVNMGFHAFEISQVPMSRENVELFEQAKQDFQIEFPACSAQLCNTNPEDKGDFLTRDFQRIVSDCHRLGAQYVRLGMMPNTIIANEKEIYAYMKQANEMALQLKKEGLKLYFHNHHREFRKINGSYILDLFQDSAPDVGFELDVHWIQRGGENPLSIIRQFAGKIDLLHLKDYTIDWDDDPSNHHQIVRFAEVGAGNLPMKDIIEAGLTGGSKYFIIEQDDCYHHTPYESLAISRDNLYAMGYKEWF